MYTVSFRIFLHMVAGQRFFLNGSASADAVYEAGELINVVDADNHTETAEVIECVNTTRPPEDYFWMVL